MGSGKITKAYVFCEQLSRREGSNFYWGFRFLPADERRALCALYAFARRTDDIVDDENLGPTEREGKLDAWEATARAACDGSDVDEPIIVATADAVRRYDMPTDELFLLIDGCRDDLRIQRYQTFDDTLAYCRKVAVTVGMSMLAIFNARDEVARSAMTSLGYGFQLTNILRDIPEDFRRNRIYLPRQEMIRHGVTEYDLEFHANPDRVRSLLKSIAARNQQFYRDAGPLHARLSPAQARTTKTMARIYRSILGVIESRNYDVWTRRPRVSTIRKSTIVIGTMLGF